MKKWKVLLVMLCAMLVSIGLFACKSNDEEEPVSGEDIDRVTDLKGVNNLSFTDENKWDDILSYLQSHARVECRTVSRETITVNGTDCEFDHTIDFDADGHCKVGNYTIKAKPKQNNPKNAVSAAKTVSVTHAFGTADEKGVQTCSHCLATRTYAQENSIIHYGDFHKGTNDEVPVAVRNWKLENGELVTGADGTTGQVFTNNKTTGKSYITDFGNVTIGGKSVKVPTLTVGQLEPGMTITVKGKAQTSWDKWSQVENKYWNFPVIGIADTGLNKPVWQGKVTDTGSYTGGTSVFVRGEGWVLYNGVGSTSENARPLAALGTTANGTFIDGSDAGRNYGSTPDASSNDGAFPASFTPGQIPSVNDWVDWVVYSTGNKSNSGDSYTTLTDIELTWNYRQDGIIELIYIVNGSKLTCMIKVPNATKGYYDTMLHGDYVDMWIESYERIETLTPTDFTASVKSDNLYYEGQMFDPGTISASFTYKQLPDARHQELSLDNIYATMATGVTIAPITNPKEPSDTFITMESNWESLAEHPVSKGYTYYRVKISKGGEDWYAVFNANEIHVVANKIEGVYGSDVGADIKNNNTVGELAISTDGTKIILTPVDNAVYAQSLGTDVAEHFAVPTTDASHRYVALAIEGDLGTITSAKSGSTDVPYYQTDGYLVLALTASTKVVTVEGLNGGSVTVFDFSKAKGFELTSTITLDTTGWELNNNENKVTVTFTPNQGKTLGLVYVGTAMFVNPTDLVAKKTTDYSSFGFTFVADETDYVGSTLTIAVKFTAANLLNYAARSIRVYIGSSLEFDYKIDYLPQFATGGDYTVDAGYYTFVSGGKIYLAKMAADATDGNNALTVNLNAGNDKVVLLNLAYNYNATAGTASFKNDANLTGVSISVPKIAGKDMILIEIDPSKNGINGTKYGYQLKTLVGENEVYSNSYFAVSGNTVTKATVWTTKSLIINEGSCQETGLSGYINTSGEVTFVATPTEFAGSHNFNGTQTGAVCQYCGETLERNKTWSGRKFNLHENEYVEMSGHYSSVDTTQVDGLWPLWLGVKTYVAYGGNNYRTRNDGWVALGDLNDPADDTNITFGSTTPAGQYDSDGNIISEENFIKAMAGADFRIWAGYRDGVLTLRYRFYKSGKLYYEFAHEFKNLTAEVAVSFAKDGDNKIVINDSISNENANFVTGKIDKTMIEDAQAEAESNVTLEVGGIENHFAVVSATGGNATAITNELKSELGNTYTKYVKVDITLAKAYTSGNAVAKVYTDAAFEHLREGAKAEFNSGKTILTVTIALGAGEDAPGTYYIDLKNNTGHTLQSDIKLDLSAVSMYDTVGTVDKTGITLINGGSLVINYKDLNDISSLKVKIGDSAAVAPDQLGGNVTWERNGDTGTLTITVAPEKDIKIVPEYVISLLDGDTVAVTNKVIPDLPPQVVPTVPSGNEGEVAGSLFYHEGVYGLAEGNKLYLYLFGASATGKDYLVFNANNAKTITDANATLLPYSLAHSVNGNLVTLETTNDFTEKVTATHVEGGSFKLTQFVIDLSYFAIKEDAQYYFYVLTTENEGAYAYSVDATNRGITKVDVEATGNPEQAATISCSSLGSKGYALGGGFFGLEVVPSHTWELIPRGGGLYQCSVCGSVLHSGEATNTKISAETFKNWDITKKGLSFSFLLEGVSAAANPNLGDWNYQILHSYAGVNMSLTEIDIYSDHSALGFSGELGEAATRLNDTNAWPGNYADAGYQDIGWQTSVSFVTIVFNVSTEKNEGQNDVTTVNSLDIYSDGVLKIRYSAGNKLGNGKATAGDFVQVFLAAVEKFGVTVAPSGTTISDLIVEVGKVTKEDVQNRYNLYAAEKDLLPAHKTHNYVNNSCACGAPDPNHAHVDSDPKDWECDLCGATIPHEHAWTNGVCTKCNEPCAHSFNATTSECSICDMKRVAMAEQTYNAANYLTGFTANTACSITTKLVDGCSITFKAKIATNGSTGAHMGMVTQIWAYGATYTRANELAFQQGNNYCLSGAWVTAGKGTSGNRNPLSGTKNLEENTANKTGMTYEITVEFSNGTVTITYKAWASGKTATGTPDCSGVATYKNVTEKELAVAFGPDGATLADGITINGTEVVNKTPATEGGDES